MGAGAVWTLLQINPSTVNCIRDSSEKWSTTVHDVSKVLQGMGTLGPPLPLMCIIIKEERHKLFFNKD